MRKIATEEAAFNITMSYNKITLKVKGLVNLFTIDSTSQIRTAVLSRGC